MLLMSTITVFSLFLHLLFLSILIFIFGFVYIFTNSMFFFLSFLFFSSLYVLCLLCGFVLLIVVHDTYFGKQTTKQDLESLVPDPRGYLQTGLFAIQSEIFHLITNPHYTPKVSVAQNLISRIVFEKSSKKSHFFREIEGNLVYCHLTRKSG